MAQTVLGSVNVTLKTHGLMHWEDFDLALSILRASNFNGLVRSVNIEWDNNPRIAFHVYLGDKGCGSVDDGHAQLTSLFAPYFDVTILL